MNKNIKTPLSDNSENSPPTTNFFSRFLFVIEIQEKPAVLGFWIWEYVLVSKATRCHSWFKKSRKCRKNF